MSDKYILDGHTPKPVADIMEWAQYFEKSDRVVAKTKSEKGDVSTVFLGIDHNFGPDGPPLIFETLVFGGKLDGEMYRCSTWEQAESYHANMVKRVEAA